MASSKDSLRNFAKELFKINAIKFGEFKTKVGLMTPVYCDLRVIVSYPELMNTLADLLVQHIEKLNYDILCGVPYTALPIATAISLKTTVPMVMRRKEAKDYGTKKLIEGVFKNSDKCLIVEDVVTSGSSILETVKDLKDAGLECTDAIVLLNREQGGAAFLSSHGIEMHALLSLTQLIEILREEECIDDSMVLKVKDYLATTQVDTKLLKNISEDRLSLSYESRIKYCKNIIATDLLKIMAKKQTNLCVAADLTSSTDLLNLAEQVGPHICALKTHIDIMDDFHPNLLEPLKSIADKHNFILFEDRKFADIGKVVQLQYSEGMYKISSWAPLVTVHSLMGKGVLDALKESEGLSKRGVFLLAEASAASNLISDSYVKDTLKLAEEYPELITGIVCQNPLFRNNPGLLQLTPGVQLDVKEDHLGQKYSSPDNVILDRGADIAVVGRGITQASDYRSNANEYKNILWKAYSKRCNM